MEKLPPIAKVYEAWSAVADGRVKLHPDERRATVTSSNGEKEYTVSWDEDGAAYSSNDNATYWQGYAGYPVIAVLMEQGELPLDRAAAEAFRRARRRGTRPRRRPRGSRRADRLRRPGRPRPRRQARLRPPA